MKHSLYSAGYIPLLSNNKCFLSTDFASAAFPPPLSPALPHYRPLSPIIARSPLATFHDNTPAYWLFSELSPIPAVVHCITTSTTVFNCYAIVYVQVYRFDTVLSDNYLLINLVIQLNCNWSLYIVSCTELYNYDWNILSNDICVHCIVLQL